MTDGLIRGAQGIADYLNRRLAGGPRLTHWAVYRMIERGEIAVERTGERGKKGGDIWARQADLDRFPGKAA